MQLAYSLGEWPDRRAGRRWREIALADAEDPYIDRRRDELRQPQASRRADRRRARPVATAGEGSPGRLDAKAADSLATAYDNDRGARALAGGARQAGRRWASSRTGKSRRWPACSIRSTAKISRWPSFTERPTPS